MSEVKKIGLNVEERGESALRGLGMDFKGVCTISIEEGVFVIERNSFQSTNYCVSLLTKVREQQPR